MSSRLISKRTKQRLVEVLFGSTLRKKAPNAHRMLDSTYYSHKELKAAYLKRLQEIHPDKQHPHNSSSKSSILVQDQRKAFVQLQEAWNDYDKFTKIVLRAQADSSGGKETISNFTKFGVGCSFSDSPEEREERDKIMNQASRGFFISGVLSQNHPSDPNPLKSMVIHKSLLDESNFSVISSNEQTNHIPRKTLVSLPPKRNLSLKWKTNHVST